MAAGQEQKATGSVVRQDAALSRQTDEGFPEYHRNEITTDDLDEVNLDDLGELLQGQNAVNFSALLRDSPDFNPEYTTVVTELAKNKKGGQKQRTKYGPIASIRDQSQKVHSVSIPSTVEDFEGSQESPKPSTSLETTKSDSDKTVDDSLGLSVADRGPSGSKETKTKNKTKSLRKRGPKLSIPQFLLSCLNDKKYNPSIIRWENSSKGIFKIVEGKQLSQLWRSSRNKSSPLKYEFFARAMRNYYKSGYLKRVEGRKLLYQFQEKSGWRKRKKQDKDDKSA